MKMNDTFREEELFGVFEPTEPHDVTTIILETVFIIADILVLLICIASGCAAILLIFVYSKFPKLRKKCSIFILHYAISCLINMLLIPSVHFIFIVILYKYTHDLVKCLLFSLIVSTCILVLVFATAIGVNWFVQNFYQKLMERYPRWQIYFIVACYLICGFKITLDSVKCFVDSPLHERHTLNAFYCILLFVTLFMLVRFIIRKKYVVNRSLEKNSYELIVTTYVIFSYLPLLICDQLRHDLSGTEPMFTIFFLIFYFTKFFAFSGPIVVVYLLGEKSKYFKAAYKMVLRRSTRSYAENDMDSDSEDNELENRSNSVNVVSTDECVS